MIVLLTQSLIHYSSANNSELSINLPWCLQVKGADYTVLESYCRYIVSSGKALNIDIGGRYKQSCFSNIHTHPHTCTHTHRKLHSFLKSSHVLIIVPSVVSRVALPTRIQKFTVLKSPHIYKKHRVQYEIRTHSRLMQVKKITGTTVDIFLEYIQRNLPEGVSMSVYQVIDSMS